MFPIDTLGAKLRHQEMLREAAQIRLAREARQASGEPLLKRMVTLLARINRRSTPPVTAATTRHQPVLTHVETC